MNFKPGDYYFSIVDFFSILVPGRLLVYGLAIISNLTIQSPAQPFNQPTSPGIFHIFIWPKEVVAQVAIFILFSLLMGYVAHGLGSFLEWKVMANPRWPVRNDLLEKLKEIVKEDLKSKQTNNEIIDVQQRRYPFHMVIGQSVHGLKTYIASDKKNILETPAYIYPLLKSIVRLDVPAAQPELDRLDAIGKFHRNSFIVLTFLLFLFVVLNRDILKENSLLLILWLLIIIATFIFL